MPWTDAQEDRASRPGLHFMEWTANRVLARETWARQRLKAFAGKTLRVDVPAAGRGFLRIDADGFLRRAATSAADAEVKLPWSLPLQMSGARGKIHGLIVEGDPALAGVLKDILSELRWDAEQQLAEVIGAIPAARLARIARSAIAGPGAVASRLGAQLAESLTYDLQLIAGPDAARHLYAGIDAAASALDDVEARIRVLEARLSQASSNS